MRLIGHESASSQMKTLGFIIVCLVLTGCAAQEYPYLPTVSAVDPALYSGTWYEIARYENRFEKGCVGASAEYSREEGHIRVINSCFDADGVLIDQATGRAYPVEGSNGAKLRVTFFRPFYGDYWILMLGEDYRYSVVGDPKRKYLWILSRTPHLSDDNRRAILQHLPKLGYNPARLYWTSLNFSAGE